MELGDRVAIINREPRTFEDWNPKTAADPKVNNLGVHTHLQLEMESSDGLMMRDTTII